MRRDFHGRFGLNPSTCSALISLFFYSFFLLIISGHDLLSRGSTGPSIPDISIAHSSPMRHRQFSIITTSFDFTALLAIDFHQSPSFQLSFDIKISACFPLFGQYHTALLRLLNMLSLYIYLARL